MVNLHEIDQSEQARQQLVQRLRTAGTLQSENIAQAFLAAKREAFVTQFLEQEGFAWVPRTAENYEPERWIDTIYRDEPLVTWVDAHNHAGSSSSAPTAMAMMLEALDLQQGNRVLEIGTGSGYNAALLAYLVGNPCLVTTIEVEGSLAHAASRALAATVGPVAVQIGDGYAGDPLHAPYDRIIVTASSSIIPRAWYEQLAPGGRIVMDLQGSLHKSGFLVLEEKADGSADGRFDPRYLYFMPMRSGIPSTSPVKRLLQQKALQHIVLADDETTDMLFGNAAFHWFLQWAFPGITFMKAKMKQKNDMVSIPFVTFVDPKEQTIIQLSLHTGTWSGYERGIGGLWETIMQVYHGWHALGRPDQTVYRVEWQPHDGCFQLLCEQGTVRRSFDLHSTHASRTAKTQN